MRFGEISNLEPRVSGSREQGAPKKIATLAKFTKKTALGGVLVESRVINFMLKDPVPPAGHDDSSTSSAPLLGLPRRRYISPRCGSDRHLRSASATVPPGPLWHPRPLRNITPKCSLTLAQPPCLTRSSARRARREVAAASAGAASVSIKSRGRSAMLKDSAPPAGHDDSWR